MNNRCATYILLTLVMLLTCVPEITAQRFSVASFKPLPNDVSAFINPVKDLNDEDCGLIKVIASDDFVFSTPLGIVKRIDNIGEIWLYLPRGSKKITVKHAEWGVLRDYVFPSRIESHMTYELRIDQPVKAVEASNSTPVITTVRDTLVLTRVDTLVIQPTKKSLPLNFDVLATIGYGGKSQAILGGVMLMGLKHHGAFIHIATNFGKLGSTNGVCDKGGYIDEALPFYTGHKRRSAIIINGGVAHRLSGRVSIFEGIGYSDSSLAWELAPSEGGGFVKNSYYSSKGVSFEAGVLIALGQLSISASAVTIRGSEWFGSIGFGIKLGK